LPGEPLAAGLSNDLAVPRRAYWRRNESDVQRWAELFRQGKSIVHIAAQERVAPSTVSSQLHRLGVNIKVGQHHVEQLPLKYPNEFIELVGLGPERVLKHIQARVWGIGVTEWGRQQVRSFCEFVRLHQLGVGVKDMARRLGLHRSTVAKWRDGTDQPYLIRAMNDVLSLDTKPGWRLLPMHLTSGGYIPSGWILIPETIQEHGDIRVVIDQLRPLERTFERAAIFNLSRFQILETREDLFAYLLGIMVGDSAKHGGALNRYASMNLDLELTRKQPTNERLGEFVMMCTNSLGIAMERRKDKGPSGVQLRGKHPSPAYRWISERSPFFAWIFTVCLGLHWGETTTTHQLRMGWILQAPDSFRKRFIQGSADSDGCTRRYVTDIATVPNANFFAEVLHSLGMKTARVSFEKGLPLRTAINTDEAASLPIFSEFVRSYRCQRMMKWSIR